MVFNKHFIKICIDENVIDAYIPLHATPDGSVDHLPSKPLKGIMP